MEPAHDGQQHRKRQRLVPPLDTPSVNRPTDDGDGNVDVREEGDVMLRGEVFKHPHGVLPTGNLLMMNRVEIEHAKTMRANGLGIFSVLEDRVLLEVLCRLPSHTLASLSRASGVMRCYVIHDELWRQRVLSKCRGDFLFAGTWYETYVQSCNPKTKLNICSIRPRRLYSDELYQPWFLASATYPKSWSASDSIPRRSYLTPSEFKSQYEENNIPVVIKDWTKNWAAHKEWALNQLPSKFKGVKFEVVDEFAGVLPMGMEQFIQYATQCQDECPLYLFEPWFTNKVPEMEKHYTVPAAFKDDMFSVLGNIRPDYRWLLVGGRGSGAQFHQDPNNTAAWNAVISGKKKWILFPPSMLPPGVHPNGDVDATSVVDWLMRYYYQIQDQAAEYISEPRNRPWECVVEAGEMIFIPHRWWHMAINLEPSVAVTHNFVNQYNLLDVCNFLETKQDQVCVRTTLINTPLINANAGGDPKVLSKKFLEALRVQRPEEFQRVVDSMNAKTATSTEFTAKVDTPTTFSFGF